MKRALAVFLCLGIAFLPAIGNAGAGTRIPGIDKSFLPPLPKPKLPAVMAKDQPALNLTVVPKIKPKAASVPAASTASSSSATLPVATTDSNGNIQLGYGISKIQQTNQDTLVVTQNASQAIQSWASFNVGSKGVVDFVQNSSSWVCLNRIFDNSPSQIFGSITAKGQIYLINQNGILFGQGSQVNVHSLIASPLNIADSDFMNGVLNFTAQDYQKTGNTNYLNAYVMNQGTITTDPLGSVFLLAPNVTNNGTISTTAGQIGLAAGTDISLSHQTGSSETRVALVVNVLQTAGNAVNSGEMTADTGLIGMYGLNIQQNGTISAVNAIETAGAIELMASGSVSFGAGSITQTPISTTTDTADQSYNYNGGTITIGGLDPNNPLQPAAAYDPQLISNYGLIQAPAGYINMTAQNRVFFGNGSTVDVSGLWIDKPASANTTQIQLNSVELRDFPEQKNGILHGATITVSNLLGSSIGDISGSLLSQQETAQERSLQGGNIAISSQGDVIVTQGASVDFNGGGTNYSAGNITTTALMAGNKTYAINNAPETLHYTGITNVTTFMNSYVEGANAGSLSLQARKVVLDGNISGAAHAGVYQTGSSELLDKMGDQKTLGVQAPAGGTLIIGTLPNGHAVEGQDFIVDSVVIQPTVTPLPPGFGPGDQPYDPNAPNATNVTYLSSQKLSGAGLSNLEIAANTTLTVAAGADISLNPGAASTVSLAARYIEVDGTISVPSGIINLTASDNVTAFPVGSPAITLASEVLLGPESSLDAVGQRIDNSMAATGTGGSSPFTYIAGGSISIIDQSYFTGGVLFSAGSTIDVSGGYGISQSGAVTGGNAGSLTIQGEGIVLAGTLKAYSLQGNTGGSITLKSQSITVAPSPPSNTQESLSSGLVMDPGLLNNTGFTKVILQSVDDTSIETVGAGYMPSLAKLAPPVPGGNLNADNWITVSPDLIGSSSYSVSAGLNLSRPGTEIDNLPPLPDTAAAIDLLSGSQINVAEQGKISFSAPALITIGVNAALNAPAGTVSLTAKSGDLALMGGSSISAEGYNLASQAPIMPGLPLSYTPLAGGTVTLSAGGSIVMDQESTINVSGLAPVTTYLFNADKVPVAQTVAGNPGSINISGHSLTLNGSLEGQPNLAGLQGGSLSITSLDNGNPYPLYGSVLQGYVNNGFDSLTFVSYNGLAFSGDMKISVGRSLTLDAPSFTGSGNIYLWAPWIQVQNDISSAGKAMSTYAGAARLTLAGDWIDLKGALPLSGFQTITMNAVHDITLTDWLYSSWQGEILTTADLNLTADRIYPAMDSVNSGSAFLIQTSGSVTINSPAGGVYNSSPIYSAGGDVTIVATNIDMEGGDLAAPMGQITLSATGNVTIAGGSTISTAGSIPVSYGSLNQVFWTYLNTSSSSVSTAPVTSAPQKSVTISGAQVNVETGSKIDVSGGGSIFAYQFQEDISGSVDPLQLQNVYQPPGQSVTKNVIYDTTIDSYRLLKSSDPVGSLGRWVIVPNADYSLPGQAVSLEGCPGLKAGVYSLLPEQYAFLPGAIIVTATDQNVTSGTKLLSGDGKPIVAGYLTYMGTSITPPLMEGFEIQSASSVLKQGTFYSTYGLTNAGGQPLGIAGNSGSVTIFGSTTTINGNIVANALPGYQGGTISLSDTSAEIGNSGDQLIPNIPLFVLAGTLEGFNEIDVNASNGSVTIDPGAVLKAKEVYLSAPAGGIIFSSGSQQAPTTITGTSVSLTAGWLDMEANSLINASQQVSMHLGQMGRMPQSGVFQNGFWGSVQIGSGGALNLTGQNIYFEPQGVTQSGGSNLYVPYAFWEQFGVSDTTKTPTATFDNINLFALGTATDGSLQGVVGFCGSISLAANDSFTINAAEIEGVLSGNSPAVVITAPSISLLNRGGWNLPAGTLASPSLQPVGSLTLNATKYNITLGEGQWFTPASTGNSYQNGLLVDGFSSLNFNVQNDVVFRGAGFLVASGILNFTSARVTTSPYIPDPTTDPNSSYTAVNFTISTGGNVSIASNGTTPLQTVAPGGTLEIDTAGAIDVSGVIQMASGTLTLNGSAGVKLDSSAQVLDKGVVQQVTANDSIVKIGNPGGDVFLESDSGAVKILAGARVDVSGVNEDNFADAQTFKIGYNTFSDPNDIGVNAGSITIYSPNAPAVVEGALNGTAGYWKSYNGNTVNYGAGGSFVLDAEDLSSNSSPDKGFSALNTLLYTGRFTDTIDIRLRGISTPGQVLTIGSATDIVAQNFDLTADNWSIVFSGKIDSSSVGGGGTIQFNSGGGLTLTASSQILSPGATVFFNTADGSPNQPGNLYFTGSIDVTGLSGQQNGIVHFRAPWSSYYGAKANSIDGQINGASQIFAEGVLYGGNQSVYTQQVNYTGNYNSSTNTATINSTNIANWLSTIENYFPAATPTGISSTLKALWVPGLEVRSTGNLTLSNNWDLTTGGWDTLGPGFLTLRAQANLNINANLVDHPDPINNSNLYLNRQTSWGMVLVSGADPSSSSSTAVINQTSIFKSGINDLSIANSKVVYSENGPVYLSSGGDIDVGYSAKQSYVINNTITYSVGTYSGAINVDAAHDVNLNGGAIQSVTGDIDVNVGGNLNLNQGNSLWGSIRTLGEDPSGYTKNYWNYANGGNIAIRVVGDVNGEILNNPTAIDMDGWDSYNMLQTGPQGWSASYVTDSYDRVTEGLATMGGGNLTVYAGGSFACQAGTFGRNSTGNLTVFSGGDMNGRFLIADGFGELHSMGNFDSAGAATALPPIELFTAQLNVVAQGDVSIGAIINPTIARPVGGGGIPYNANSTVDWDLEYAHSTSAGLFSATGDVSLYGDDSFYGNFALGNLSLLILPPTVTIAAHGDINIQNNFALVPWALGNLTLVAGNDINASSGGGGQFSIHMSEMSDALPGNPYDVLYGPQTFTGIHGGGLVTDTGYDDPAGLLHANDTAPVVISAGGDIVNLALYLPKQADIWAGGNITNFYYFSHNDNPGDVTTISAQGDILFSYTQTAGQTGIQMGGPGSLIVQAAGYIDLGTSLGIQAMGNVYDPSQLPVNGCTLVVASGYTKNFSDVQSDTQFFQTIQADGTKYSDDLAAGNTAQAKQDVADAEAQTISPFFAGSANTAAGAGDIDMTLSQISSLSGAASIIIFANGNLNVGKSAFASQAQTQSTGIFTAEGGAINIFANKDVNVNESRVMTFEGGDITVWSDAGSINAGRGSKSVVDATPPGLEDINGQIVLAFSPPPVGSGVRAVTYNPDPEQDPDAPPAGNIYLFAPTGVIDAGEAGIAGRNVILGAVQVINANNISFSGTSVGVPSTASLGGLGALSGTSAVTQGLQSQEAAIMNAAAGKLAQGDATSDAFSTSWLEVRVLSFFNVDPSDGTWESTDN